MRTSLSLPWYWLRKGLSTNILVREKQTCHVTETFFLLFDSQSA